MFCVLCGEDIQKTMYNLNTTYSEASHTLLIKFVEEMYENISLLHYNICLECYILLNELDSLQVKQQQIQARFISYISKTQVKTANCKSESPEPTPKPKIEVVRNLEKSIFKNLPITIKVISSPKKNYGNRLEDQIDDAQETDKVSVHEENALQEIRSIIQSDLAKHIYESKNKPFRLLCEMCGQVFKTKSGYDYHVTKHKDTDNGILNMQQDNVGPSWVCHTCGKNFTQKVALHRHFSIHSGEKRYQCDHCGKQFVHHSSFRFHMKIHEGKKEYQCLKCDSYFRSQSHMRRHIRSIHSKEKSYACEVCGKKFAERYNLTAHMKGHKKIVNVDKLS